MKRIHLLKPGTFVDNNGVKQALTASDIDGIAGCYDAANHEAPVVVGHPRTDSPAFGWVKNLEARDGQLYGAVDQVSPAFAEAVRAGTYKKLSVALYGPQHASNPTPGTWHLRHVGFLGGQPPVVKGLDSIELAEGDEPDLVIDTEFSEAEVRPWVFGSIGSALRGIKNWIIEEKGLEVANNVLSDWLIDEVKGEEDRLHQAQKDEKSSTSFSEKEEDMSGETTEAQKQKQRQAELDAQEASLAEREAKLKKQEEASAQAAAENRQREAAAFAEQLAADGKVLPRHKTGIAQLLTEIPAGLEVAFAEADGTAVTQTGGEFLREFLASLPEQVDYAERSAPDPKDGDTATRLKMPADGDVKMGTRNADLHSRTLAFAEQHNVSYAEALTRVSAG